MIRKAARRGGAAYLLFEQRDNRNCSTRIHTKSDTSCFIVLNKHYDKDSKKNSMKKASDCLPVVKTAAKTAPRHNLAIF